MKNSHWQSRGSYKRKKNFFFFANLGWETTEETKPEMHKCEGKILIEEIA